MTGRVYYKPEHCRFWSNLQFDRNIVSGTGAWFGVYSTSLHDSTHYMIQPITWTYTDSLSIRTNSFRWWNHYLGTQSTKEFRCIGRMRGYQLSRSNNGCQVDGLVRPEHDDVIKWKHFPRYWPFVRGIHRSPVNSPHKGQWRGALMFTLIWARIHCWVNTREAGDLRRYPAHCDVRVMGRVPLYLFWVTLTLLESHECALRTVVILMPRCWSTKPSTPAVLINYVLY